MKTAQVIDPAAQPERARVYFGATVTLADEHDGTRTITLVGEDETDTNAGRIAWSSPIARALRGATVGDVRQVMLPAGTKEWEVMRVSYPE